MKTHPPEPSHTPATVLRLLVVPILAWGALLSCTSATKDDGSPTPADASREPSTTAEAPAEPGARGTAGGPAPWEEPATPPEPLSPECRELIEDIRARDGEIPLMFHELPKPVGELNQDLLALIGLSERFLRDCGETAAAAEVKSVLARVLVARRDWVRQEIEAMKLPDAEAKGKLAAYDRRCVELAESASRGCRRGSFPWMVAQRMLMETYYNTGQYAKIQPIGRALLDLGDIPYLVREGAIASMAYGLLAERRYEENVALMHEVIAKHGDTDDYATYNIRLFEALTGMGDLEGIEELMHLIRTEYPGRIEKAPQGQLQTQYRQWYWCQSLFWLGFARMALGDSASAAAHFERNIAEIDDLEAKSEAEGTRVDPVCPIYRDFRSQNLLTYLRTHHGKPMPEKFFDEMLWVTDERLTAEAVEGKVLAVAIRRPGDVRSPTFLQEIDVLVREKAEEGLVGMTLSFLTGKPNPEQDARMARRWLEDLSRLGAALPAAIDADREGQKNVRGIFGTVGTASFVVIDRKGRLAWFLADPRDVDRRLAVRVIERILAE